jgi:restriction endonuclease
VRKAEQYKPIGEVSGKEAIESSSNSTARRSGEAAITELKNEVLSPLERDLEKLRDPFVLAAIMNTAANERENTNRLLKTIIERLDAKFSELEERMNALEAARDAAQQTTAAPREEILLPGVDEEIVEFVRGKWHATAEEVRARFNYRGKNAASSRLNRLYGLGVLGKRQVGRAVVYFAKTV